MNITKESEEFPEITLNNLKFKELDKQLKDGVKQCSINNRDNCENCSG
jgi:hypothetical protein